MATEQQARRALDRHQDNFRKSGAHSLSVQPLPSASDANSEAFAIVVMVDKEAGKTPAALPSEVPLKEEGRTTMVPVIVRESEPFHLE